MIHITVEQALQGRIHHQGREVTLTRYEMAILYLLSGTPEGRTMKDTTAFVWGEDEKPGKAFSVHMFNLRKKIEKVDLAIKYNAASELYYLTVKK